MAAVIACSLASPALAVTAGPGTRSTGVTPPAIRTTRSEPPEPVPPTHVAARVTTPTARPTQPGVGAPGPIGEGPTPSATRVPTPRPSRRPTPAPVPVVRLPAPQHRSPSPSHPTPRTPEPGPAGGVPGDVYDQAVYSGWQDYLSAASARERLQSLKAGREEQAAEVEDANSARDQADSAAAEAARNRTDVFSQLAAAEAALQAASADAHRLDVARAALDRQLGFASQVQSRPWILTAAAQGLQHLLAAFRAGSSDRRALAGQAADLAVTRHRLLGVHADAQGLVDTTILRLDASGTELLTATQRRDQAAQRAVAAEAEVARLDGEIARAKEAAWAQAMAVAAPDGEELSPGHSTVYRFIWPEPRAWISQGWGPSSLLGEPAFMGYAHFHTGVDLAAPANTIVYAADDGVVAVASEGGYSGYGNFVILNHEGGVSTLYGHLNRLLVAPGDHVHQGQPIGLEGSTGYSTGPHLHFEARINGTWVNPLPFLPPGAPSSYRQ